MHDRHSSRLAAWLLSVAAGLSCTPALAGRYRITMLSVPGQMNVQARSINDRGQIAGFIFSEQGEEGFTATKGVATLVAGTFGFVSINDHGVALDSSAGQPSYLTYDTRDSLLQTHALRTKGDFAPGGFNNFGQVVGTVRAGKHEYHAYLITGHKMVRLVFPGSVSNEATSINDDGLIAGTYNDKAGNQHCFSYQAGNYTNIDPGTTNYCETLFVSQDGLIGLRANGYGTGIRKGTNYKVINVPKSASTTITGIGPGDEVVGLFAPYDNAEPLGFVYRSKTYHRINIAGAQAVIINGVNARGDLVGVLKVNGQTQSFVATCPMSQAPCTK